MAWPERDPQADHRAHEPDDDEDAGGRVDRLGQPDERAQRLPEMRDRPETLRHAHYWAICRRLEDEHRIRGGHAAAWATDQAFALSAATVYEEYVVRHGWSLAAATESIVLAAVSVVLEPGTGPVLAPPPDRPALEAAAAARAIEQGADASRFPAAWRSREGDPAT